jgi:hypothetical protein
MGSPAGSHAGATARSRVEPHGQLLAAQRLPGAAPSCRAWFGGVNVPAESVHMVLGEQQALQ